MKWLLSPVRIAREIGLEFIGLWRHDVERCAQRVRLAKGLGPAWAVTEALDLGKLVLLRFERASEAQAWQMLAACVDKATGAVTVTAEARNAFYGHFCATG